MFIGYILSKMTYDYTHRSSTLTQIKLEYHTTPSDKVKLILCEFICAFVCATLYPKKKNQLGELASQLKLYDFKESNLFAILQVKSLRFIFACALVILSLKIISFYACSRYLPFFFYQKKSIVFSVCSEKTIRCKFESHSSISKSLIIFPEASFAQMSYTYASIYDKQIGNI